MNYRTMVKGALALSLSLIVGTAWAADTQTYGATFEASASQTVGEMNDFAYGLGTNITAFVEQGATPTYGWFGAAEDESKIIAANGGQALQLNTDANTLTNKFKSIVSTGISARP